MILNWNELTDNRNPFGGQVFRGVMESPAYQWESVLPDLTQLGKNFLADPALGAQFGDITAQRFSSALREGLRPLENFIGELVMHDFIVGTRQTLAQTVQTVGILSDAFKNLYTIFNTNVSGITDVFKITDTVLDSKVFEMALNAIGAIPIVGWIIKIVYELAKSVANLISSIKDMDAAAAQRMMASRLTLPPEAVQFSPDTDDAQTRAFFRAIGKSGYDPLKVITPSYNLRDGFVANAVGDPTKSHAGLGWVVSGDAARAGAIGFVPGSVNITRSFFIPSRGQGGGPFKDIGSLYPTASNLCTGWWSNINKPGPSMFSFAPLSAKSMWEEYIEDMFVMCRGLLKGWTFSNASKVNVNAAFSTSPTDKFVCEEGLYGYGECKKSKRGQTLRIPDDAGRDAHTVLYGYLAQLFFGVANPYSASLGRLNQIPHRGSLQSSDDAYRNDLGVPFWKPDSINYSASVPCKALDDLYSRQVGTLASLQCMYVNGEDREAFPAFKDASLRKKWADGVTDVFSSGAWRRVVFQDMPEGSAKDAFYQNAKKHGIKDVETYNRPCAPGEPISKCRNSYIGQMLSAGPGIKEAPSLPAPPMNDVVLRAAISSDSTSGSKSSKGSALPLILAVGALGLIISKRK